VFKYKNFYKINIENTKYIKSFTKKKSVKHFLNPRGGCSPFPLSPPMVVGTGVRVGGNMNDTKNRCTETARSSIVPADSDEAEEDGRAASASD
jgi:hypothetical protein